MDDRAVSTTVGYVTSLGIAAILISGLLVAGGGFVEDQRERTVRSELQVIGQQMISEIDATDRLARNDGDVTGLSVRRQFPERVTGVQYTVDVDTSGSRPTLVLSTDDPDVTVTVAFETQTPLRGDTVRNGDLLVRCLDTDGDSDCDELEVTNG